MPSWRDSASQYAQDDLDSLLNSSLPLARQMLEKHGEFFPFGAAISLNGETRMVVGDPGQGERPESDDVIATVLEGFTRRRDDLRAVARRISGDTPRPDLVHQDVAVAASLLTDRLVLRWWTPDDLGALSVIFAKPEVWRFPFRRGWSAEETEAFLRRKLEQQDSRGWTASDRSRCVTRGEGGPPCARHQR
jgi:hypothetical protein